MALFGALPILPGSAFLPGAHHPHCDRFDGHLVRIGGRPLCLGCTCMGLGFLAGAAIGVLGVGRGLGFAPWVLAHAALVAPTAIQPWVQRKGFKILARSLLGLASATWLFGPLWRSRLGLPALAEYLIAGGVMGGLALLLLALRDRRAHSPCSSCPSGSYPTCDWNLPRILAGTNDPVLHSALGPPHFSASAAPSLAPGAGSGSRAGAATAGAAPSGLSG